MEPVLEQYRPIILSSLKFSKFTLGTVAPQFTGWFVFPFSQMVLDFDLNLCFCNWFLKYFVVLSL